MTSQTSEIKNENLTQLKVDYKNKQKNSTYQVTSISELGNAICKIQEDLIEIIEKLNGNETPEFKTLMESYVRKANEVEELKVRLENSCLQHEEKKAEITKIRETNRSLMQELQITRDMLENLENKFNSFQVNSNKNEEEGKIKIQTLNDKIERYETKIKELEEENINIKKDAEAKISEVKQNYEEIRQEAQEQSFNLRQIELDLTSQRDNLLKQVKEFELLINEKSEELVLKTKEIEYKDALMNQLIKQGTTEKLQFKVEESTKKDNKKKSWFLNKG